MNTWKHFWLVAISLMTVVSFTSCGEDDEEIGFDISGLYGKVWVADLGEYDHRYPLYSEFEFMSGASSTHGAGRETVRYQDNDEFYERYAFDWEVRYGDLILYYDGGNALCLYDVQSNNTSFSAYVDNDNFRTWFECVAGRSASRTATPSADQATRRSLKFSIKNKE